LNADATPCDDQSVALSGLAITAVVFAFLGILGGLTAPLAFVLGIVVLWRARRGGPRLDPAFGVLTLAVSIVAGGAGLAVVGVASHQAAGGRLLRCQRQIEQIGDALLDYAEAHGEQLPAPQSENELHSLLAPYLAEAGDDLWICPTGARYIPNPDLAGWYLDELDPDYDILVFETIDGESMAFPHHGYGWPKCGLFYFADGAADWLEPGDIEHDGPEDGLKLPGDAEFQPLTGPAQPRRPAAG